MVTEVDNPTPVHVVNDQASNRGFHWDFRVPIALILTLGIQGAGIGAGLLIWGTHTDTRLTALEIVSVAQKPIVDRFLIGEAVSTQRAAEMALRLGRIEDSQDRLEDKVDRLIERPANPPK